MSKSILITVGPIPARLDSVKFLTNRFKGGLGLRTARMLKELGHNITLCAFKHWDLLEQAQSEFPVIVVDDVVDYYHKVLAFEAQAYVLSAAVANLMPSNPWEGKFPSHQYAVGDRFQIEFEIAPRVIDAIKERYPAACLVAYKLFDGSDEALIDAARHTLSQSKANVVFANNPKWAKERKRAVTADGALLDLDFDQHVAFIDRVVRAQFYRTEVVDCKEAVTQDVMRAFSARKPFIENGLDYGCVAVRAGAGFWTTTRGKRGKSVCYVTEVDHASKTVYASAKATLNAPLIAKVFELNPTLNVFVHGHGDPELPLLEHHEQYEFPGTLGDLNNACVINEADMVTQPSHGWWTAFASIDAFCDSPLALDGSSHATREEEGT